VTVEFQLVVMMSGFPSPFMSVAETEFGPSPTAKSNRAWNVRHRSPGTPRQSSE